MTDSCKVFIMFKIFATSFRLQASLFVEGSFKFVIDFRFLMLLLINILIPCYVLFIFEMFF